MAAQRDLEPLEEREGLGLLILEHAGAGNDQEQAFAVRTVAVGTGMAGGCSLAGRHHDGKCTAPAGRRVVQGFVDCFSAEPLTRSRSSNRQSRISSGGTGMPIFVEGDIRCHLNHSP